MIKTINATEARIHFGEVMRQAQSTPIIVERDGKPMVVVLSKQAYDDLVAKAPQDSWRWLLQETHRSVRADLAGRELPPAEEFIHQGRQERDEGLADLR